ncbi:MAG TPA: hypothetical protein VFT80_10060 [Actinomycetota bacterium]|nr:hypothetical protein [Actinomycetota bacterium]
MDARPAPDVYDDEPWELAAAYRVTLWEQPARPPNIDQPARGPEPFPGAPMGWEEMTFELAGAQDVREVIKWAATTLASGDGPASRRGVPVQDREYVIYAKAQGEDRWLHVAGWTPVMPSGSPLNLRRLR